MLIDRNTLPEHLPWIVACLVVAILGAFWFAVAAAGQPDWPTGSSAPGFTFGVVGGLICLFEFLLWPKKALWRTWRIGTARAWMRAHVWLGLLAVPLLVLHSGFRWGGALSTILMVLFLLVIASGVWGLTLQQFLPRTMLADVPAETIYSQIERVAGQFADEAERLVAATCGPEVATVSGNGKPAGEPAPAPAEFMVVGAVRAAGAVRGKVLLTKAPAAPVPNSEELWKFFTRDVRPYLLRGRATRSVLADKSRSAGVFDEVRGRVPRGAYEAVAVLEDLCEQRRQLDRQARLHRWLHSWLWVHLPLSVALIVLMFVHIPMALRYW